MTFPTALKWEHEQFDTLVWQRTEWCQPIIKGILDGHFLLLSISHKVMTFIHMSCLIFVSCVLYCLAFLSVYMIQLWLWSKRSFFLFSFTCSLYKLPFPPWCPQLSSGKNFPTKENATTEGNCLRKKNLRSFYYCYFSFSMWQAWNNLWRLMNTKVTMLIEHCK